MQNENFKTKRGNVIPIHNNVDCTTNLVLTSIRLKQVQEFIDEHLIEDLDYGFINGFSKPTLLKPGAEKLCNFLGCSKSVYIINRLECWDKGIFAYEIKVTLAQDGKGGIKYEGIGSCNSKEAQFKLDDPFTIVNTVLKMAKKRAFIDAVLTASQTSSIFTQNIEVGTIRKKPEGGDFVTKRQLQTIHRIVSDINMNPKTAKEMMKIMYQVDHSTKLTKVQASNFIQDLQLLQQLRKEKNEAQQDYNL